MPTLEDTMKDRPQTASRPHRPAATVYTRCWDCGEAIEVDPDGFRTLCACDAAE